MDLKKAFACLAVILFSGLAIAESKSSIYGLSAILDSLSLFDSSSSGRNELQDRLETDAQYMLGNQSDRVFRNTIREGISGGILGSGEKNSLTKYGTISEKRGRGDLEQIQRTDILLN